MSDQSPAVQRWQAPFFEKQVEQPPPLAPAEVEALAQSRGYQVGKWEGLQSGRAEAESIVCRLIELLDAMAKPYGNLDQVVTRELVQMSMLIAEQIVRRELTVSSGLVTDMVAEAISTLSSLEGKIEVFVNPADAEVVREQALESLDGKSWKLMEDPEVLPGGCRVKTPTSFVDASIEKQMEMVFSSLLESCEEQLDD